MKTWRDIEGWFPDQSAEALKRLIEAHDVRTIIEVGSYQGRSTVFFAGLVDRVHAVDTFKGSDEGYMRTPTVQRRLPVLREIFKRNLVECGVADKVAVHVMTSLEAAARQIRADMVFIDASHRYDDVRADLHAWWPLAGKVLCGDDYHWADVRRAVNEFGAAARDGRIWSMVKPSSERAPLTVEGP